MSGGWSEEFDGVRLRRSDTRREAAEHYTSLQDKESAQMGTRWLVGMTVLGIMTFPFLVQAQVPADLAQTAKTVAAWQNSDGGFGGKPGQVSSLGATSSAVRILKYTGGAVPDVLGCIRYVQSCFDAKSGGFATTPGGAPDIRTTAVGLMAVGELKVATAEQVEGAIRYFHDNAKSFEDLRIAVAGLEAVAKPSQDFERWTAQVLADRNPDGTFGTGTGQPRATGSSAAALLRMGQKLEHQDAVLKVLREGQRPDGGWSKDGTASDLETTYRIMRCFFMLKQSPDLEALGSYLARHRRGAGTYASKLDGAEDDTGGTYFASIIGYWSRILSGQPAVVETAGFRPLFNGKDLTGWEGDLKLWTSRDGMIVGESPGLKHNDFLATEAVFDDFILKFTFKMTGDDSANSGVQFRSVRVPGHEMSGYQADIGQGFWGCLYDESRRNRVLAQASPQASKSVRQGDWNNYVVRAMGENITLTLNGVNSVQYKEQESSIARDGKIAVQIHAGKPMTVRFKDLMIQSLPRPVADEASTPGFHLRTLKSSDGERKYTVALPAGYDRSKKYPVVLFLHGSGERGTDGVTPAQVGLGPGLLKNPAAYPVIAIFPQARQGWSADSADARAALAALDEVLAKESCDPSHVVLTGLSMGGRGTWEIGSANPKRFVKLAPICGMGRTESADAIKGLPVWCFVGDADRDATVLNSRALVVAVRSAGGVARYTEYRGVGHNSWDRAYEEPGFAEWLIKSGD